MNECMRKRVYKRIDGLMNEWIKKNDKENVGNISFLDAHLFAVLGNGGHVWFHLVQFFLQDSYFVLKKQKESCVNFTSKILLL